MKDIARNLNQVLVKSSSTNGEALISHDQSAGLYWCVLSKIMVVNGVAHVAIHGSKP